ncbi:RES domain-containing protein [Bradyrhizobium sp.]|jgi:hypothetical protein|uniref:RES domain-containing protein n=1 Tax=Bradyrhizobium sp. TaxID=376 RepID=UPI002E06F852|nr:RES domain-containing protein [Bradyrhizobium sp.]
MAGKRVDAGFHITRAELNADRLSSIVDRRPLFSAEQKRIVMAAHVGLVQPTSPHDLLMMKFRRAGRRVSAEGSEVGTIGRYHYWRNCLYFSDQIETVFAEAAYYMHAFDGIKVGAFKREYRVFKVKITDIPVSINRRYQKVDMICDRHPLQKIVEDKAMQSGWSIISAPSARMDGHRSLVVYDPTKVVDAVDVGRVELFYDNRSPSITWNSNLLDRKSFVLRTVLH